MTGADAEPEAAPVPPSGHGLRAPLVAMGGVALAVVVGCAWGARPASFLLVGTLAAAAAVRALAPGVGRGLAVRSRIFDIATFTVLAAGIAILAATAPDV